MDKRRDDTTNAASRRRAVAGGGNGARRTVIKGDRHMTRNTKRAVLAAVAAGAIAIGVTAGERASAQNTNQDSRPFRSDGPGRFGGPGMPGGPGGPLGMLRMLGPQLNLTDTQKEQIKPI